MIITINYKLRYILLPLVMSWQGSSVSAHRPSCEEQTQWPLHVTDEQRLISSKEPPGTNLNCECIIWLCNPTLN